MKRFVVILLVLLLPLVSAMYEKKVYDGWIKTGMPVTIDGTNITFSYMRETNTTVITFLDSVVIIDPETGDCAKEGIYSFCQTKQAFYKGSIEVPPTISSRDINTSLYFKINSSALGLNISKTYDEDRFYKNIPIDVEIRISRMNSKQEITSIMFNDSYSGDFRIIDVVGCSKKEGIIYLYLQVYESDIICTYTLVPQSNGTFTSAASLNYDFAKKAVGTKIVRTIDVKNSPIELRITDFNESFRPGESYLLNFTLTPHQELSVTSLVVAIPKDILVMNRSPLLKQTQNNVRKDKFEINETMTYFVLLNSTRIGDFPINISIDYIYHDRPSNVEKVVWLDYALEMFEIELIEKGLDDILRISNGKELTYKDISIQYDNMTLKLDSLEPRRYKEFLVGQMRNDSLEIRFMTQYGERIKVVRDLNLSRENQSVSGNNMTQNKTVSLPSQTIEEKKVKNLSAMFIVLAVCLGLLLIVVLFKKGSGKSQLDKEIEEIKKQGNG
ncbi:MAG: hypothetical protein NDI94_04335 [Candidatus Woesearchaeota archaeon]|nr:hypothetical protein [Candidatus Woesearchaeota archaeon]